MIREVLRDEVADGTDSGGAAPQDPVQSQSSVAGGGMSEMARELAALRSQVSALTTRPSQSAAPAQPAPSKDDLTKEFYADPIAMADKIASARVGQALGHMQTQFAGQMAGIARDKVRGSDPEIFDRYAAEIDEMVTRNVHPSQQGDMQVWATAFNAVKGAHVNEIIDARMRSAKPIQQKADGPTPAAPKAPPAPAIEPLTEEEKFFIRKWGTTEESYRESKEFYANQSATGESSWDKYITTDNTRRKRKTTAA